MTNTSNAVQTTTVDVAGNTLLRGGCALSNYATSHIDVITGTGNVTITGPVTKGGTASVNGLTKAGDGALVLSGANSCSGGTTVYGGVLQSPTPAQIDIRQDRRNNYCRFSDLDSPIFVATTGSVVPELGQSPTYSFAGP